MVDVGSKPVTTRTAVARGCINLGSEIMNRLSADGWNSPKGGILQTAILAGVMGAKQTPHLIPLCHSLPLHDCQIVIEPSSDTALAVTATVSCEGRTGVEMEAMTAVSIACLTIYDMTKALSLEIEIGPIHLMSKSGGRRPYQRSATQS